MPTAMRFMVGCLTAALVVTGLAGSGISDERSADEALNKLMQGNIRCSVGQPAQKMLDENFRKELAKGQRPYAVVVACSDSRVAPEIVFDENLGQIFVVRTAGNVVDSVALGSIEYAVEHLHVPLIMVMGHESCGAVKATVDHKGKPEGNIGTIVTKISPAVKKAKAQGKKGDELVYASTIENVRLVASDIRKKSPVIRKEVAAGKVKMVGGYYSISAGKVENIPL